MNTKELKEELLAQKEALEIEKRKLKTIIETIPDLLWLKDLDGKYLACNKRFEDFFGASEKEIVGKTDYDFVDKDLADFFREHDNSAIKSPVALVNDEEVQFASDGHKEVLNTTKVKIHDNEGNVLGVLGIGRDITQIKESQTSLEKEKLRYQKIMEHSTDAIFIVNLEGYLVECSNQFLKTLGYTKKEAYALHVSDYEAIHSKELIKQNIAKTEYEPLRFESIYRRKDGSLFDVSLNIVRVKIDDEEFIYSSFRDISEEKKLQHKILKQKEELETIFNYSHDGIAIIDTHANFLNLNPAFMEITGYTKEELLKENCINLTAEEDKALGKKMLKKAIEYGHTENFEKEIITKNNISKSVNVTLSLLPDRQKLLMTLKDISSLKYFEQNSKLASVGEMIGNIAHQWRQPLNLITTSATGLKFKSEFDDLTKEDIDQTVLNIQKQAKYLSETIDNFRNYLKGESDRSHIKLKDIIDESVSLVSAALKNNYITIDIDVDNEAELYVNKNELSEAFINILNNSKDALKSNIENEDHRFIFIKSDKLDEDKLELQIYDSAGGIEPNIIENIFEPYFTTKGKAQGTGLGLAITKKIFKERLGTDIKVENKEFEYNSNKYKGACFTIIFKIETL